ncbi:MAG: oligopeptide/dipeptide ABC transporter ATP-binding protein, partial [Chloroflexota bacterium]
MSDSPLLEVRNLSVSYRQGRTDLPALRDVSLTLMPGESYGIIGESGSGKSTLGFAIMRHLGDNGRIVEGDILFKGASLPGMSDRQIRTLRGERMAMVYQQPQAALNPSIPLGDQIAEVFTLHKGVSRQQARRNAVEMLGKVRINDPEAVARLYPHQASGGMQQRAVIAMALALRPDLIILDEPTTALDVTTQAAVLELLEELRREFGTTLIFVAHDLAVITRICERVAVLYAGELVEEATLDTLFREPKHPYTAGLLECLPSRGAGGVRRPLSPIPGRLPRLTNLPPGCIFEPRCRYATIECVRARPALYETGPDHRARCIHWPEVRLGGADDASDGHGTVQAAHNGHAPLLQVEQLAKSFRRAGPAAGSGSAVRVLQSVDLEMNDGDTIGLVGESGSGKTTLARCILGLSPADDGRMRFAARDLPLKLGDRDTDTLRELQMVFQNPDMSLNPGQTIRTILTRPIRLLGKLRRAPAEEAARDLLRSVNLDESYMDRYPGQLSGGEKQRVA